MNTPEKQGVIFDISRFCLNDGPGIRTTVFLKGCPLKCVWCHNPESQKIQPEILFSKKLCTGCGKCANVCPNGCHTFDKVRTFDRTKCTSCGLCTKVCLTNALRLAGRYAASEEIIQEVIKDKVYFEESEGGLTVSGGEPMMQAGFLEELLRAAKSEGIHTCIETCGHAPETAFVKIAPYADCFLFDCKETDPEKHRMFTGHDNRLIRRNLAYLNSISANVILRIPLIPGYNDSHTHMEGIAAAANAHKCIKKIEILPYHPLGISKAEELGLPPIKNEPAIPAKAFLDEYLNKLRTLVDISVELCV